MSVNPMLWPTLALTGLLFGGGVALARRHGPVWRRGLLLAAAAVLAVPGLLMALYYLHKFDSWAAFYEFRSLRGSELAAAGVGLMAGMLVFQHPTPRLLRPASIAVLLTLAFAIVALPYAKSWLAPARPADFRDSWDGAVCRQSTVYSCGPACAATLLRSFGLPANENQLARECFTTASGTESWYLARALRGRGLHVAFVTRMPGRVPAPAIAGVKTGGAGHFVAILEDLGDSYRVADPLIGAALCPTELLEKRLQFTGFFLTVEAPEKVAKDPNNRR